MKTRDKHLKVLLKLSVIFCLAALALTACGDSAADGTALSSVIEKIPEEELDAWDSAGGTSADPVSGDTGSSLPADSAGPEDHTGEAESAGLSGTDKDQSPEPDEKADDPESTTAESAEETVSPSPFIETVPRHDYSAGHGYYYRFLGSAAAAAYDDIYYSCENSTGEVNFTVLIPESDFYNAWDAFRYDHPEYFWIRNSRQGYSDSLGNVVKAEFNIPEDATGLSAGLIRTADGIVSGILSLSERDRVRYIYEWIINSTSYSATGNDYGQCAAGVLFDHRAVCAGYADAFKLLCDRAGIKCITVVGDALNDDGSFRGRHAWNQVQIGGAYYWVDTTWGDPQFGGNTHWDPSFIDYSFLCISDDPFLASHRIDSMLGRSSVPGHFAASYAGCSDPSLDEYTLRGCLFNSAEEVMSYIMAGIAGGQNNISVKLAGDAGYRQTVAALFDGGGIQQILDSLGPVFTECQYFTSPVSRTLTVEFR